MQFVIVCELLEIIVTILSRDKDCLPLHYHPIFYIRNTYLRNSLNGVFTRYALLE